MSSLLSGLLILAGIIGLVVLKFKILKAFIKITLKVFCILLIVAGVLYLASVVLLLF